VRRLIRVLFTISDGFAWLVGITSLISAAVFPFVGPVHSKMTGSDLSIERITFNVVVSSIVAIGAFMLIRRKVIGLLFVIMPCFEWVLISAPPAAIWYGVFVIVVFGSPFALTYAEVIRGRHNEQS